jgi:hypothetical protein
MKQCRAVLASTAASIFLFLPDLASGQQDMQPHWQGQSPSSLVWQSSTPAMAPQQLAPHTPQRSPATSPQSPPTTIKQSSRQSNQAPLRLKDQGVIHPNVQEIPAVWQPPLPATNQPLPATPTPAASPSTNTPGYVGLHGRDFYLSRFCMHALTIQGVEVVAIEPNSPAARAGLRPAQPLTTVKSAVGAAAGVMTVAEAQPLAATFIRAFGGMPHGDIILAVAGRRVNTFDELQQELAHFAPQTVVYFTVRRGENVIQLPVRLAHGPASGSPVAAQEAQAAGNY